MNRNRSEGSDQERHVVLRQMLEERRGEIQGKLRSILDTLPDEKSFVRDAEEQSVNDFVREVDFTLMQMKSDTLSKIDDAIRRLEAGSYGVCTECGADIAPARLAALPFAERCRDCQERQESAVANEPTVRENLPALGTKLREGMALSPDQEATKNE